MDRSTKNEYSISNSRISITGFTDAEYTAIENDLHTYTSTYRNGTAFTDTCYSTDQTGLTSAEYTALKKTMLKSVYTNGGFWVGRYEAGIKEDTVRSFGTDYSTEHATTGQTPVIQANKIPYNWVRCNQAESLAKEFGTNGKTSSLLFGVQWDLVLRYLESKGVAPADLNSNSTSWGNYNDNTYSITGALAKYSTNDGLSWTSTPYSKTSSGGTLLTTGASSIFSKNNIYDIAGNVFEWTMEYTSTSSYPCAARGGYYVNTGSNIPASHRSNVNTTVTNYCVGFRVALY